MRIRWVSDGCSLSLNSKQRNGHNWFRKSTSKRKREKRLKLRTNFKSEETNAKTLKKNRRIGTAKVRNFGKRTWNDKTLASSTN